MKFKHVIATLVIAGAVGTGSAAKAESGFEGAMSGIKSDMRSARMALRHVNSSNSKDLLRKLAKAERQLREAMLTLAYVQESVAGAMTAGTNEDAARVRGTSSWTNFSAAAALPQPSPTASPAPTSSTKPLQTGGGFM
jgi:hypothetical protein